MSKRRTLLCYTAFLTAMVLQYTPAEGSKKGDNRGTAKIELKQQDDPLVMVGILARNTAHTLPNFLGYFENLDYPKHRMSVW